MRRLTAVAMLALVLAACGREQPEPNVNAYALEIMHWRAERLERLKQPTGYLNQIGLFWLQPGTHSFGSDPATDVRFPAAAAAVIGYFEVGVEGVWMQVRDGVDVQLDEAPVDRILIADDTTDAPLQIRHGSLAWSVIRRDGRFAVRLRDFAHPFVATFGPLPYYPVARSLRVPAVFRPYDEPRIANVDTVIEGLGYHPESPGTVEFEIGGEVYSLEAYASGDRFFFVFGDQTNRDDTYGAGRFLYADRPDDTGRTVMDFNQAYSPPCAFNDFSTCPVASPRNRLPIRIEAGEKYDPALHYSADGSLSSNVSPAFSVRRDSSGLAMAAAGVQTPPPTARSSFARHTAHSLSILLVEP